MALQIQNYDIMVLNALNVFNEDILGCNGTQYNFLTFVETISIPQE